MDYEIIKCERVYHVFRNEFTVQIYGRGSLDQQWQRFISNLDIGLECVGLENVKDTYKIVDEKKWFLAKIKHGL